MSVPIVGQFECRAYILAKYGSHALRICVCLGLCRAFSQATGATFSPVFATVMGVERSE